MDSILLGCIPVFFHADQARQWPWHFAPWANRASVLLDASGPHVADVIGNLSRIPSDNVRSMQRVIAQNAWRLVYRSSNEAAEDAWADGDGEAKSDRDRQRDAFSIILARLAERRSIRDPEGPRRDCRSLAHADRNTTPVNSG